MAYTSGACDLTLGQAELDLRIPSFREGIRRDSMNAFSSSTEQGSTASNSNGHPVQTDAMHVEPSMMAQSIPQPPTGARNGRQAITRKRRYRDERQKLSNSMAQRRYRERKKRAFDDMKMMVDDLTQEVAKLQYVKRENEKLTLEMQAYRQLAQLHGMASVQMPTAGVTVPAIEIPARTPLTAEIPSSPQLQQCDVSGQPPLSLQSLPSTDWLGTLSHICQSRSSVTAEDLVSVRARVNQLEKEWNERMIAVEHIARLQTCGSSTGASNQHMLPILRTCMASMFTLNSDIACMKFQQLSQETQANSERIQKAFIFMSNDL